MHGTRTSVHRQEELVTLVDDAGQVIGAGEKHVAHLRGLRHRAFSIFLVDERARVLLQQRHPAKYHSGGLWANSCCGHPRPGEELERAAARRLYEELGVRVPLRLGFSAAYRAEFDNGLVEDEVVSVFFGRLDAPVAPDPAEISRTRWMHIDALARDVVRRPDLYAVWLRHYFRHYGVALTALCNRFARRSQVEEGRQSLSCCAAATK